MEETGGRGASHALGDTDFRVSASKSEVFKVLKLLGYLISEAMGDWCEVVIHDLDDLEHSVVWIQGDVTGRKEGSPMTDLGLKKLRTGDIEPVLGYATQVDDRCDVKSSSLFVCDEGGEPMFAFCVNFDLTPFVPVQQFLQSFLARSDNPATKETFSKDLRKTVQSMIDECAVEVGVPIGLMGKPERLKLVRLLEDRGAFQLKKSIPIVASELGVSRRTIYNYLDEM